jgi:AcrR family transcriptional regulator
MMETFQKLPKKRQYSILDSAAKVFAKKGYDRANITDICKKAKISNGALYKYFKNKEDVFFSVFDRTVALFSIRESDFFSTNASHIAKIGLLLNRIITLAEKHPEYIVIYYDLGSPSMSKFANNLSEKIEQPAKALWLKLIREAKQKGDINRNIDDRVASYIIDNHVMNFMFACVSKHHEKRFNNYFGKKDKLLTNQEKIDLVLKSIGALLGKPTGTSDRSC